MLGTYAWSGNVRELANVVERAVVLAVDDEVGLEVLPEEIVADGPTTSGPCTLTSNGVTNSATSFTAVSRAVWVCRMMV